MRKSIYIYLKIGWWVCFFRCIEILGRGCLNEQAMADLVKIMIATMTEHFERQADRNKKRSDEDYDEGTYIRMLKKIDLYINYF